ncbi:COP9 signalosome complex subunit 3 [Neolecta irregularis DAH-3]|uniref:COP9 signalosome complex subunit 3 n=1 Tax=Neolecta irregularis (strain DAH-3) TaxID=1198029 RepID=A0A1U7LQH3_NEOID|nr:COP9 signalosome complex subunit 3 [Neolecta irregularis DAH-3]|eukprot:OLL24833.1 COP9 signalosome complex subunit 3 [Neolecta irregularis DAH-3]
MPKNASLALQRATTSVISRAYSELATAMQSDCHARVLSVIDKAADVWTEDGNIGLVNLCFNTIPKRIIKKLREIYVTITLQELSRLVFLSPQDAKSLLQQMTSSNNIIAEISSSEIVTFPNTNPTELNSTHTLNLLNNLVQLNKQLGSSKEYLAKQNNSPKEGFVSEFTVEESIMDQDFKDDDIMDFE